MGSQEMLNVLEENLPPGATQDQRVLVLKEETRNLEKMSALAARIYPFVIGVGLLGQIVDGEGHTLQKEGFCFFLTTMTVGIGH